VVTGPPASGTRPPRYTAEAQPSSSNLEIAAGLVVSGATVKSHVASILQSSACATASQVVIRAYESGLIEPGDL